MKKHLLWYRNDLRIDDHMALQAASTSEAEILPLVILPPHAHFAFSGLPRTGLFRQRFQLEAISDLNNSWNQIGSSLLILQGKPDELMPELCRRMGITAVFASKEIAPEEIQQEQLLQQALAVHQIPLTLVQDGFLIHPNDLFCSPANLPDVFTVYRKKVEQQFTVSSPVSPSSIVPILHTESSLDLEQLLIETQVSSDPRSAFPFPGGQTAAQSRIQSYFWETNNIASYKETRNGLIGQAYSSKLSPWLAQGAISARSVYHQVKQYEAQRGANDSTYWLVFELLWRDYFRMIMLKYGAKIFQKNGLGIYSNARNGSHSSELFHAWIEGKTGEPFIDANMKELQQTGFMSNRGRQNVASFLVHQLQLDWRLGAEYFESQLLDYDVSSNWGNWAYVAGVGTDPRERIFNSSKQALMYDPDQKFQNLWNE
jgi:deoxyribodipyrimidine photo-lyase